MLTSSLSSGERYTVAFFITSFHMRFFSSISSKGYGVFGFEQNSVDELSFEEMLTPDGVYKAKEAALERLRKLCRDSAIPTWRCVSRSLRQVAQGNSFSQIENPY